MADKKRIIYCEDQQRFRDEFMNRHKAYYDIVLVDDTRELLKIIDQYKHLPDLVLIDLYHPRESDADYESKRLAAEESLEKLDKQIEETNTYVLNAWEPGGLEVLKLIRHKYPPEKLKIAFYTQKGLVLLGDSELREAKQLGAEWMIKKKMSSRTEKVWMDQMMMETLKPGVEKSTQLYRAGIAISWLITGVLLARTFFSTGKFEDIMSTVIIGILSAIASYLISPLIEKLKN